MRIGDLVTVPQCARELGCTPAHVETLIRNRMLKVVVIDSRNTRYVSLKQAKQAQKQGTIIPKGYVTIEHAMQILHCSNRDTHYWMRKRHVRHKRAIIGFRAARVYNYFDLTDILIDGFDADEKEIKHRHEARERRLNSMRRYLAKEDSRRAERAQRLQQKETIFPLQVQAQKEAIREAVAKLKQQKEKQ